jgi:hypothetical protein
VISALPQTDKKLCVILLGEELASLEKCNGLKKMK